MQRYTVYFSGNCSTCFGWYHHPSSGAQTTVSTASGICHTVTAICCYRGRVGTGLSVLSVAYATHSTWSTLFQNGPLSFYDQKQIRLRTLIALHFIQYLLSVNIHSQAAFNIMSPGTLLVRPVEACMYISPAISNLGKCHIQLSVPVQHLNSKRLYFFFLLYWWT